MGWARHKMKEKGKRRWREEEKRRKNGHGGWWGLDGAEGVGNARKDRALGSAILGSKTRSMLVIKASPHHAQVVTKHLALKVKLLVTQSCPTLCDPMN